MIRTRQLVYLSMSRLYLLISLVVAIQPLKAQDEQKVTGTVVSLSRTTITTCEI